MNRMISLLTLPLVILFIGCDNITVESPVQGVEGIQVTGTGSAFGEPDVALLSLGVSVEKTTVKDARDEAAAAMQRILDTLKAQGIADEDLQTRQFSIQPQFNYIDGRQVLRGYLVTNTLSVKIRDIDSAGEIIDDAVDAGGDLVRIQSITFTIDDPRELQAQARIEAMQDAEAKAQTLAEQGGVTLGKPISISESFGTTPPVPKYYDSRAQPEFETPVQPGQLEVTVTVNVIYAIEESF